MNIIKEHIEYLKDNPEGYWFKRKLYGWGWTPATREGWAVTAAYVVFVLWFAFNLGKSEQVDVAIEFLAPLAVATLILLIICYKTGEPPKWMWGPDKKPETHDENRQY